MSDDVSNAPIFATPPAAKGREFEFGAAESGCGAVRAEGRPEAIAAGASGLARVVGAGTERREET
jgi:hypothetical protein